MALSIIGDQINIKGKNATIKQKNISVATATTTELNAAIPLKQTIVFSMTLNCADAQTVQFKSGTTNIGGVYTFKGNYLGLNAERTPPNYFIETAENQALNMVTTTAIQVSGSFTYVEV